MNIRPCPRCRGEMKIIRIPGTMKSFPEVVLRCTTAKCGWNMGAAYDEFTEREPSGEIIKQWNEGIEAFMPRWIYDRLPEAGKEGWYRVRIAMPHSRHRRIIDEKIDIWDGKEWMFLEPKRERYICWLWHPEPIDEKEKKG